MTLSDSERNLLRNQVDFLGIRLDALTLEESVEACAELVNRRNQQHVVLNASKTVLASQDATLKSIINNCGLVNADGQSVVWGAKLLGQKVPERVTGIDLMGRLLDEAPARHWRVYLLGARQEVVRQVAVQLRTAGVDVVGYRNGYWSVGEEQSVVADISNTAPDLLFVAMPSPRKEQFLTAHLPNLNVGLAFGVGGSFDVLAGETKRAPVWMQRGGLEWFFRLVQEPRRMFGRYLIGNTRFAGLVLREKFARKH